MTSTESRLWRTALIRAAFGPPSTRVRRFAQVAEFTSPPLVEAGFSQASAQHCVGPLLSRPRLCHHYHRVLQSLWVAVRYDMVLHADKITTCSALRPFHAQWRAEGSWDLCSERQAQELSCPKGP